MFFSTELLSRRDSGFGLLWLAATLGSKSSFKKLPKRSVVTADIPQLCDLIAEPEEPLALRLSSNLMVGVVRVYKVKQELFLADVSTCFHSLKKAVQDLQLNSLPVAQLQMGQSSVRPDTVTLQADPGAEFAVNFDHFFAEWDEVLGQDGKRNMDGDQNDGDYGKAGAKSRRKNKQQSLSLAEIARAAPHTLEENLEQLLSTSFDASFNVNGAGDLDPSSSQMDGGFGFGFDDNPFGGPDDLDLAGIGEELAKELGEGWGVPGQSHMQDANLDIGLEINNADADMNLGNDFVFGLDEQPPNPNGLQDIDMQNRELPDDVPHIGEGVGPGSPDRTSRLADSPVPLLEQGIHETEGQAPGLVAPELVSTTRKPKRSRLLLDTRTELTDEELQAARTNYLHGQNLLRDELELRRFEKDGVKIIEEIICGVPRAFTSQALMDFWSQTLKVQIQARFPMMDADDGPARKRRRTAEADAEGPLNRPYIGDIEGQFADVGIGMDIDAPPDVQDYMQQYDGEYGAAFGSGRIRSSEEPGEARRASRPPSGLGSYLDLGGAHLPLGSSQRSSLFPWDNAGLSSSAAGGPFGSLGFGSGRMSVGQVDIQLRRSRSGSRRASSVVFDRMGSVFGDVRMSPMIGDLQNGKDDDFVFNLPGEDRPVVDDSQISEMNLMTLERNSHNFLEYTKMQLQSLPLNADSLTFDDVVPKDTSTPHVAAAAFYHCLVLATKDLLRLDQPVPYGAVKLTFK